MTESPQARQRVSLLFIDSAAIKEIDKFSIIIRKNERSKRNVTSSIKKTCPAFGMLTNLWKFSHIKQPKHRESQICIR